MAEGELLVERFDKARHDRAPFDSREEEYTKYLKEKATQHTGKGLNALYVAVVEGAAHPARIYAYFTLSMASIDKDDVDEEIRDELAIPRLRVPSVHIGMMASDKSLAGQNVGAFLITEAGKIGLTARLLLGCWAVTLDVDHDNEEKLLAYYRERNFSRLRRDRLMMGLPLSTLKKALDAKK